MVSPYAKGSKNTPQPEIHSPRIGLIAGNSAEVTTAVGPVIDQLAFDNIQKHITQLKSESKVLQAGENNDNLATKNIANPVANLIDSHAFEVARIADVKVEIFGPVLQVVRRGTGDTSNPEDAIAQINALGYGLTVGS